MNYEELTAEANLAFSSNDFSRALDSAKKAIQMSPHNKEAYVIAGKIAMSMENLDSAIEYFQSALALDKSNGNILFLLAYAQAYNGDSISALRNLTRALENHCDDGTRGQIYKMIVIINSDQNDFDNALINLKQAEDYIGVDYEILQQKTACYANLHDYHQTIFVLNQMKLLSPKEYKAYSLTFNILYDEAKAELERAEKFANLTMAYYILSSIAKYPKV